MRALLLILLVSTSALASPEGLTIGSKTFPESRILAEIMAQLVESRLKVPVTRRFGLGGTMICFSALKSGDIDLYAEYTGTALVTILERPPHGDPLRVFMEVQQEYAARYGLTWLAPFGFNNGYALAVPARKAAALKLETISDLRGHPELRVGVSHEFLRRPDAYPGLRQEYGLQFSSVRGMEHGLAYQAIAAGQLDLIDVYTTDGNLLRYDLKLLEDDRHFFPPYLAAPVVRQDALERHPELRETLGLLAYKLDDEAMQSLNLQVEGEGRSIASVASQFLEESLLLDETQQVSQAPAQRGGLLQLFLTRPRRYLQLTSQHLQLVVLAVALATLLSVPLGILATRRPALADPLLGTLGTIQTIPSLALLAFMIPVPGLGLGWRSAVCALFLYALLPIVRNTYTGIKEVDPVLLEAARGMGLSRWQTLRLVQLPLAMRTIMAGIRTSCVISVGVATLAAFIGAGGLGEPIISGLQLNDTALVLSGALPAATLAILVDLGLGRLEKALTPRGLE